ncbi:hypothetical protein [Cohnella sp. REN36]|uniref:hypothetical protein n=1 Tax=Cohnella sp. REN36 TaxID=2887347 RepID=UPI001D14CFBE|nr:hypothetical protein [Cohnella sp. REN36]MCC3374412.1 hypothetical protein [Cohnella sp. REN36]
MTAAIPGLLAFFAIVTVFQWLKLRKTATAKERLVYLVLLGAVWLLGFLLHWLPLLPGPTQLVKFVFGPLSQALEKGG